MAVVVFPTPLGPMSAPLRWLGGYGAGGCGKLNSTSLGRFSIFFYGAFRAKFT
jgi:hypothetical protein